MQPLIGRLAAQLCDGLGVGVASPQRSALEQATRLALWSVVLAWRRLAGK